jgi:cytochrome bd-type quinol oxidase subunit 2
MIDNAPAERPTDARPVQTGRAWGTLGWAGWLPEVANGALVAIIALGALASLVSYSDAAIRQSLVDTYEPSAWNFIFVSILAVVAIGCAFLTRAASERPIRRKLAAFQVALMLLAIGVTAFGHYRLMRRTTGLTGQTFGGFP